MKFNWFKKEKHVHEFKKVTEYTRDPVDMKIKVRFYSYCECGEIGYKVNWRWSFFNT